MLPSLDFNDIQEKFSHHVRPWQRSLQFWVRAVDIYSGYKVPVSASLSLCVYVWKFLSLEEFHWVCFGFGLGSLRCFKFEYVSRRMCKSKTQCGKDSMSLRLTRFMPCAPTSVGFSWRYLEVLPFNFKLVFSRVACSWIWINGEGIVWWKWVLAYLLSFFIYIMFPLFFFF